MANEPASEVYSKLCSAILIEKYMSLCTFSPCGAHLATYSNSHWNVLYYITAEPRGKQEYQTNRQIHPLTSEQITQCRQDASPDCSNAAWQDGLPDPYYHHCYPAKANRIHRQMEPVPNNRVGTIVSAVKSSTKRTCHKFGTELPRSIRHAYEKDEKKMETIYGLILWKRGWQMLELPSRSLRLNPAGAKIVVTSSSLWRWITLKELAESLMDISLLDATHVLSTYAVVVSWENQRIAC
jgi:hypothetical protein